MQKLTARLPRRRVLLPLATLGAFVVSAVAFAAWTANGTGTATATAGTASNLSISGNSAASLYPTAVSDLTLTLTNPNPYAVTVTTVSQRAAVTVDAAHSACNVASVTFAAASGTGLSVRVPAAAGGSPGTADVTLEDAVAMSNAAVDACQGATFTVPLSLTGASS